MPKTYFNWSTGKDSALALYQLLMQQNLQIDRLLTTVNAYHDRVSMHGLRRELLNKQVDSLGIPATVVELPQKADMEDYDQIMANAVDNFKKEGYTDCAFGDIFLEDLRAYREKQLEGIQCHFPLWKRNTTELFREFIDLGFKAVIICLNGELLDQSFLGRELDQSLLNDLPDHVDPCGENGEFHTFCYDGPIFSSPIAFEFGEKILRKYPKPNGSKEDYIGYWFLDLVP